MSEANLTGGGGGGVPIGGTDFFPNAFPVDFVSKGQRFLRTGNVETDPAKFDAAVWGDSVGADFVRSAAISTTSSDAPTDVQSDGNTILMPLTAIASVFPRVLRSVNNGSSWSELAVSISGQQNNAFYAVEFGAGKFVLVGGNGLIATSTDGLTYTQRASGVTQNLFDVKWNGSIFVAVGVGVILTSPDGITWQSRTMPTALAGQPLLSVEYGNNTWVAVGGQGVCVSAPADGSSWTARTISGQTHVCNAVLFDTDASKFYVGGGNAVFVSSDGANWAAFSSLGPYFNWQYGCRFTKHNGYFYWANAGSVVIRSKDFTNQIYLYPRGGSSLAFRYCKKLRNGSLVSVNGQESNGQLNYYKANLAPFAGHPMQIFHDNYGLDAFYKLIAYVRIS